MRDGGKVKPERQNICNAGEYYIASILSANGFTTTITLGRAEKYDIIAINPKGKTIKIQVKTLYGKGVQWRLGEKNEKPEKGLFYVFIRLNDTKKEPDYWIVPSKDVAYYIKNSHIKWLKTLGLKGQKHDENYKGRAFRVMTNKYSPKKNWTEICKKYCKNVKLIS